LFGSLPETEVEPLEEHLLVRHTCIDAAEQLMNFARSLHNSLGPNRKTKTRAAGRADVLDDRRFGPGSLPETDTLT
jgi:hypothetical protein